MHRFDLVHECTKSIKTPRQSRLSGLSPFDEFHHADGEQ